METIRYREVLPRDVEPLRELNDASFPIKYDDKFYQEVERCERRGSSLHTIIATCLRPSTTKPLDEEEEYLVGAITFQILPLYDRDNEDVQSLVLTEDDSKSACYIMTVAVHKNFRKQGIASHLLLQCQRVVQQDPKCVITYLHVIHWNDAAMALYSKHDFKELKKMPKYYHFDDDTHDAFLYGKLTEEFLLQGERNRKDSSVKSLIKSFSKMWRRSSLRH